MDDYKAELDSKIAIFEELLRNYDDGHAGTFRSNCARVPSNIMSGGQIAAALL